MPGSSSTIKIASIIRQQTAGAVGSSRCAKTSFGPPTDTYQWLPADCSCRLLLSSRAHRGQLNYKSGAARIVGLSANPSAMLEDYPLYDCEPQACAASTRREIRLKQSFEICRTNSMAVIGNVGEQ